MTKATFPGQHPTVSDCTDDDGSRSVYTLSDASGESQDVVVCQRHGEFMPLIDGELVTARPGEGGIRCDFRPQRRQRLITPNKYPSQRRND